jgi:hypothetical protein
MHRHEKRKHKIRGALFNQENSKLMVFPQLQLEFEAVPPEYCSIILILIQESR